MTGMLRVSVTPSRVYDMSRILHWNPIFQPSIAARKFASPSRARARSTQRDLYRIREKRLAARSVLHLNWIPR